MLNLHNMYFTTLMFSCTIYTHDTWFTLTGKRQHEISMNLSVHPAPGTDVQQHIVIKPTEANPELSQTITRHQIKAINLGMISALTRG